MNISLLNPLAILDLEATGLSITSDRIIEIAIIKVFPTGEQEEFVRRVNPEIPIPANVTEIHGISDEDVKDAPTFKTILPELEEFLGNADFAGAITAGKFLVHFTDYPWIHLDIAGPTYVTSEFGYRGKGATAIGVRLIYNFIKNYTKI